MADVIASHPRCQVVCAECGEKTAGQVRRSPRTRERDGFYVFKHGVPACRGVYRADHEMVPDTEEEEGDDASDRALMGC